MIRPLRKFLVLSRVERGLLLTAWMRLLRAWWMIRRTPFEKLRARLCAPCEGRIEPDGVPVAQIVWAVKAASRRFGVGGTCLTRAIVAQDMLRLHGHDAEMKIGVMRYADGKFSAHAWLVRDGRVLIGSLPDLHQFQEFPNLQRRSA